METRFYSLCIETYRLDAGNDKFSFKGVNKKNNVIHKDKYLGMILSKPSGFATRFRVMSLYVCASFSYFYLNVKDSEPFHWPCKL